MEPLSLEWQCTITVMLQFPKDSEIYRDVHQRIQYHGHDLYTHFAHYDVPKVCSESEELIYGYENNSKALYIKSNIATTLHSLHIRVNILINKDKPEEEEYNVEYYLEPEFWLKYIHKDCRSTLVLHYNKILVPLLHLLSLLHSLEQYIHHP